MAISCDVMTRGQGLTTGRLKTTVVNFNFYLIIKYLYPGKCFNCLV